MVAALKYAQLINKNIVWGSRMQELVFNNINKEFTSGVFFGKKTKALDNVSFSIPMDKPWIVAIVGESGSGKTTLARVILDLLPVSGGEIILNNEKFYSFSTHKDFIKKVQPIFQNPFTAYSSYRTVDSYMFETSLNLKLASNKKEAKELISKTLNTVGLEYDNIAGKYISQFSGGELQRIAIARALLTKPEFIVADEPVAMVDASLRTNIINLFKVFRDELKVNIFYITHDLSTAHYVSDYTAVMLKGSLVEYGATNFVLSNPKHPYTKTLLSSIPTIHKKWDFAENDESEKNITKIKNSAGCKFVNKCKIVSKECFLAQPPMIDLNENHKVCCFNTDANSSINN